MESAISYHNLLQLPAVEVDGTLCRPASLKEVQFRNELGQILDQFMQKRALNLVPEKWVSMTCINYLQPKHLNLIQYVHFVYGTLNPAMSRDALLPIVEKFSTDNEFPELLIAYIHGN